MSNVFSACERRTFPVDSSTDKMAMMANVLEQYVNNVTTLTQQGNRGPRIYNHRFPPSNVYIS